MNIAVWLRVLIGNPARCFRGRAALAVFGLALLALSPAWAGQSRPILVGSETDFPPYADVDEQGRPVGFSVELFAAVAKAMDIPVEYRGGPWGSLWQGLQQGTLDALPLVARLKEREGLVAFTSTHTVGYDCFFVRRGGARIDSIGQAATRRIIVMRSDAAHDALLAHGFGGRMVLVDTLPDAFRLLASGGHDAVLAPLLQGNMLVKTLGLADLVVSGSPLKEYRREFAFAVNKDNTQLRDRLEQGLAMVKASGEYDRIYDKWLRIHEPSTFPTRYVVWGGFATALVLAVLSLWSFALSRRVGVRTRALSDEIEERKKVERELLAQREQQDEMVAQRTSTLASAEARMRLILESTADGLFGLDAEGRITFLNPAVCRLLGFEREQLIGQSLHAMTHHSRPDGRPYPEQECPINIALHQCSQASVGNEVFWHADGHAIPVIYSVHPMIEDGRSVGAVVSFVDISERKRTEQALEAAHEELRQSEALLRIITDNTPDPIYVMDIDSHALLVNPATLRVIGKSEEQVLGRTDEEIFDDPEVGRALMENDRRVMAAGVSQAIEERIPSPQGERIFLSIKTPYRDAGGRVIGIVGISHDITERKEAERLLRDADRRKDEFLAMLAHELRNPLVPIRNAAHVLGQLKLDEPRVAWARNIIEGQVDHLGRLVEDLLDVSRIARGKIQLKLEHIELIPFLECVVESARPSLESRGHHLVVRLPSQPVAVMGDRVRLCQVLLNLLDNAAKYTPEGGRVELDAGVAGNRIEIRVRDNGIGIPAELMPHVFDLFQQGEQGLDRAQGGLGIGLTLVRRLAEMHGGSVDAFSEGQGRGSTFTLRLPLSDAVAGPSAPAVRDDTHAATGRRVLVVDDDPDVADSTAVLLELEGNQVAVAPTGEDALKQLPLFHPDVVLLDIGLKGMDGFETARRLRAMPEGAELALVAVTGYGDEGTRAKALEAGCDFHMVKPVKFEDLARLLAKLDGDMK